MGVILPTRRCFDDALEFCEERARAKHPSVRTTLRLVHGIIRVPADHPDGFGDVHAGDRSVHAWVEDGDLVYDAGVLDGAFIRFSVDKAEYYAHYRIEETRVYTMAEALTWNLATGHYGPWQEPYRALCRVTR